MPSRSASRACYWCLTSLGFALATAEAGAFTSQDGPCVLSTSRSCACSSNYDPAGCEEGTYAAGSKYENNERCTFHLVGARVLETTHFETEGNDYIIVGDFNTGTAYGATAARSLRNGPDELTSDPLHWKSDGSVEMSGFRICTGLGPPMPPVSPPLPPQSPAPPGPPPRPPMVRASFAVFLNARSCVQR